MEKIADVLQRKYPQFNTIQPTRTVNDALYQMHCENVDHLIVLENNEQFVGILTEHDIASKVLFNAQQLDNVLVKDFMTTALPVTTIDDSLEYAMQMLEHHNTKFLVVYDQFTFKGVLSAQDLMKQALTKRKEVFEDQPKQNDYRWNY
jgi:signal-transduction protein with cAMP-binding, CBS, and nucleotidyltransferase domain